MSFSETEHLVFLPTLDAGMTFGMQPGADVKFRTGANNEGDEVGWASGRLQSALEAWDPVAGKRVWRTAPMPFWGGGVLSTASGLVFQGSADGRFSAYLGKTGKPLKSIATGTDLL